MSDLPLGNSDFWLLAAALIGAVFNPWMVFYQQSATAEKRLDHRHYGAARGDTALGAVLTQVVSASVLFVAAATLGSGDAGASLAQRRADQRGLDAPSRRRGGTPGLQPRRARRVDRGSDRMFAGACLGARRSGGPSPIARNPAVSRTECSMASMQRACSEEQPSSGRYRTWSG